MRFDWDVNKDRANRRKHRVGFDTATQVFKDPLAHVASDRIVMNEERWRITGWTQQDALLVVVFTRIEIEGEEYVRIISARRADRHERRDFEGGA